MKKVFPTGGRQLLDGGLNDKYAPSIIQDDESPDCLNVIFSAGAAETRLGSKALNTTSVGSFACDGIYSFRRNDNTETMCAFFGGLMYVLTGVGTFTTVASAQSVFTSSIRVAAATDENYIFFGNGGQIPYKYNGEFTRHGIYPPTQTMSVASNGVGALTASGQYQYVITNVNTNIVESDISPVTTTFTISSTSGQNTLNSIPTAPQSWGVSSRFIYRTKANTTTPFYKIGTLPNNTTTTFNDNIPDTQLVTASPTDNGIPPKWSSIIYAAGRLFCNDANNPNFVWYSNLGNPYSFPSTNFFKVGDNTSDLIKGLDYHDGSIVVFCENSIWLNYMASTSTSDWTQIKVNSPYGSKSPFGVVRYNNKLLFPAVQNQKFVGFGALVGNTVDTSKVFLTVSTTGTDLKSDTIEPDMYNVQEPYLSNISAIIFKKKAWIAVTYGTNQTTNNRIYQMDFSMSNIKNRDQEFSWCPFTGMDASQFCVYGGNLYFGTSDLSGFVYAAEQAAYNDNGNAIDSYIWTKEFVGQEDQEGSDTNLVKDFRYANVLLDNSGSYNINFWYRVDSDKGQGNVQQVSVDPGGSKWGTFVWGTDPWGGGTNQSEQRLFLANARGRRIQFRVDNQKVANQKFKVHGLNFLYNVKGYR